MSLASEAREAAREHPFLLDALRAGVVNYRSAAEFLDLSGDVETVAAALRRYAEGLSPYEVEARDVRVRMRRGVGLRSDATGWDDLGGDADGTADRTADADATADEEAALLSIDNHAVVPGAGPLTAIVATGEVDAAALDAVLSRLVAETIVVDAAGVVDERLVVVVPGREGAAALRVVEAALGAVPT